MTALNYALQFIGVLPTLIETGQDIIGFINNTRDKIQDMLDNDRDPTTEEWKELDAKIEELRGQLSED